MPEHGRESIGMQVSNEDMWTMLLSTFRYSLGRSTYITGVCVDLFKRYKFALTDMQQKQIVDEVRREISSADLSGRTVGMVCDHDIWRAFVEEYG